MALLSAQWMAMPMQAMQLKTGRKRVRLLISVGLALNNK
jgi:hypothetical protein